MQWHPREIVPDPQKLFLAARAGFKPKEIKGYFSLSADGKFLGMVSPLEAWIVRIQREKGGEIQMKETVNFNYPSAAYQCGRLQLRKRV